MDFEDPRLSDELWKQYKELDKFYWSNRSLADLREYEHYRETMRYLCRCHQLMNYDPDNIVGLFFSLLMLPLTIWGDAVLFSAVKLPCQAEKMYISILKKRIIPDIFKTS